MPNVFLRFAFPFLVAVCIASTVSAAEQRPPNVLMICVDDLKPTLGCYGDQHAVTPNIDALAARGLRFESAYCNQAVCAPSRNALMTGLRPQTIGIYDLGTNFRKAIPDATTMTTHFMNQGYRAEGLGKIYHIGQGNGNDAKSWSVPWWRPRGSQYVSKQNIANHWIDRMGMKRGPATESVDVADDAYADAKIAAEAVTRLERASKQPEQPFFLAVGFVKPHLPFVAPKKYWDLYDANALPMPEFTEAPENAPKFAKTNFGELLNYSDMRELKTIDEATTRHLIHGYYAATSYMDAQAGKVLDALDQLGLADNTIVVLWGDHGWHLGDHGMWCKHTNYEQATRIPFIVASSKTTGTETRAMVETVDVYPTLCDLTGVVAPEVIDGISFADVVTGSASSARPHVTHVYPRNGMIGRAIRDSRYRMVEWKKPAADADSATIELYDYVADPLETKNIASEQPQVVDAMRALLAKQPEAKPQWRSSEKSEKKAKQPTKKKIDRNVLFDRRDADGDGALTMDEFLTGQPDPKDAPARFPRFDKDGDGKLSREEFVMPGK
ncbi:Choline-sulfatase [Rubripirellula amarantea]|uniref:Choline-sulfatase n=1 Tax=Rubripirellula amarantea TaxID=2527999 RepID=A0A5C5WUU4_9BACT|nr:sulfatase-like hydrolase/transferase [Rubripirellula amarantea]TWT54517.1 Choline-sulfatase [Rubripirellula amarantea]